LHQLNIKTRKVHGSEQPYGDRIVFLGDCGVSRLYKDGIGAAYRAAKISAETAIFHGISAEAFRKHYLPFCRKVEKDNQTGKFLFKVARIIQKLPFGQQVIVDMISSEQMSTTVKQHSLSMVLWDMLTGGALYRDVLYRALNPVLLLRLAWHLLLSLYRLPGTRSEEAAGHLSATQKVPQQFPTEEAGEDMRQALGKIYQDGEAIIRQGDTGNSMYVIQDGYVEVVKEAHGREITLAILGENDFFGEMAIFENEVRAATVRAIGTARILTIDSKNLLRRMQDYPYFAYRLVSVLSNRVRKLGNDYAYFSYACLNTNMHGIPDA
jgi:hypothetical protein